MTYERPIFVMIDVQEKLVPAVQDSSLLVKCLKKCLLSAKLLDFPIVITEQYPQGLGHTISELLVEPNTVPMFTKTAFSACADKEFLNALTSKNIWLSGIETHICIYQTAIDLLNLGFNVTLVEDGVAARNKIDHDRALDNLAKAGANISTFECLFMNILRHSKHPSFKQFSAIMKM